jgi:hypothetical protein
MAKLENDELPCPKCAEPIKTAASKCKHCGHELSANEVELRKKLNRSPQSMGVGCVVVIGGAIALAMCTGGGDSSEDAAETAADRQAGFHCLSGWDGSHREFVEKVKARLRDPGSFEHVETRVTPNNGGQHAVIMEYRARNGFGGMNVGKAMGTFDHETCTAGDPIME